MAGKKGRSGGARLGSGKKRQLVIRNRAGERGAFLRDGDVVAVIDATGPNIARVAIEDGALVLVNDRGQRLTVVLDGGSVDSPETAP